jgi:hypothetical protein
MQPKRETKVQRCVQVEPDEDAWIAAQAAALRVPYAYVIRRTIRAAMDAEARDGEGAS